MKVNSNTQKFNYYSEFKNVMLKCKNVIELIGMYFSTKA